jgi:hypothetical protein
MPLQNRVNPFGAIFRSPVRGTMMGNRGGPLHNDQREIERDFKNERWIACLLEFRGVQRSVMSPGRYTELFFLDEAVAFAAGHRPCAECRRERFTAFKTAWTLRDASGPAADLRAPEIDRVLHRTRVDSHGRQRTYEASLNALPNGTFVHIDGSAYLVWDQSLLLWTPEGYARKDRRPHDVTVSVLTPQPVVECFRQGYEPTIHHSGRAFYPRV